MRIIIIGCGKVGTAIVSQLSMEKHDVTIVDQNADVVNEISNRYDVMGIVGNGASFQALNDAGVDTADLLIAITDQDEINLLCCLFARKVGNCNTIARVRNPRYREEVSYIKEELGLALVLNPDYDAAMEIARILRFPSANKIETFAKGKVELLRFSVDEGSALANKTLIDVGKNFKSEVLICAVERDDQVFIPNGSSKILNGDIITILSTPSSARDFFKKIGHKTNQVKNTMIVGGGRTAYYLASQLINSGIDVKIVENDRARSEELSDLLPKATIICGDATNEELLLEEGIEKVESFVSLTGMDEGNLFLSLYAKKMSKAKVVTKVNHLEMNDIIRKFSLGSIITPKNICADMVVSYVRARNNTIGSNVETLYKIVDNRVEALEFKITEGSPIVGRALEEIKLKKNLLIGCVISGNKASIANGKTVINPGDTVVVITTITGLGDIADILES